MKQRHTSWRAILSLTLVVLTTLCVGCSNDTAPALDAEGTDETVCDGIDDDHDGRIDEGLLNACLGCTDDQETSCLNTTIALQATEPSAVTPVAVQYRIYNSEPRVIMEHVCVFERIQSYQPIVLTQALTLSQEGQAGTWSTDPSLADDTFVGVELDGVRAIDLSGSIESVSLQLEVKPPAPPLDSARQFVAQCSAHFESTETVTTGIELQAPHELFIGGSTQLEADPSETATSFFVLSGTSEPGSLMMSKLTQDRPYLPEAIRCTISASVADSQAIGHNGFQLSAQTSVASALSFDERPRPSPIRSFQSIEFAQDIVRVNLSALDQWGSPQSVELTRSGDIDGIYESQKLTCTVVPGRGSLEIAPDATFPPWLGDTAPQEILRLNWTKTTTPFEAHPNLVLREALTIQKRKNRD